MRKPLNKNIVHLRGPQPMHERCPEDRSVQDEHVGFGVECAEWQGQGLGLGTYMSRTTDCVLGSGVTHLIPVRTQHRQRQTHSRSPKLESSTLSGFRRRGPNNQERQRELWQVVLDFCKKNGAKNRLNALSVTVVTILVCSVGGAETRVLISCGVPIPNHMEPTRSPCCKP